MDAELLRVANEIASGASTIKWLAIVLVICVGVVAVYLRSRIGSYAKKLGEIEAETSKLDDIKAKVEATTRVTAEIQSTFAQRDWRERERITLTRKNLEDALAAAYAVREGAGRNVSQSAMDAVMENNEPLRNRLSSVVALHLPSLKMVAREVNAFALAIHGHGIVINGAARLYSLMAGTNETEMRRTAYHAAIAEHQAPMQAAYAQLLDAVRRFEDQAAQEMERQLP